MMKKTDSRTRIPTTSRTSYQNCYSNCNLPSSSSSSSSIMAAETNSSRNPILEPLLHALDPISLILNQNSQSEMQSFPFPLKLTSADSFIMERGPNYNAYAELRERRLQMKLKFMGQEQEQESGQKLESKPAIATTPPRKQVKFLQSDLGCGRKLGFSSVAQSVPDFSAVLRKENRKPVMVNTLPSMMEMTPQSKRGGNRVLSTSSRGSKSASGGEKGGGGGGVLMARKSYANFDELKRLTSATAIAINGEGRGGGRNSSKITMGRTVSGKNRQF